MVLLDLLRQLSGLELIVAHFDHGIRPDSAEDKKLVQKKSAEHGLPFEFGLGNLGPKASEDIARKARYDFLKLVKEKHSAMAIVTAHHQDDVIETALINLLRGTGRKGLTSLKSTDDIRRPLLAFSKKDIRNYANKQGLEWREDTTNEDVSYLRNYVRLKLVPKLSDEDRHTLLEVLNSAQDTNKELDNILANYLQSPDKTLSRKAIIQLPHVVGCEVMAAWLRRHGISDFDSKTIQRLVVAAKTLQPGRRVDINNKKYMLIGSKDLDIKSMAR